MAEKVIELENIYSRDYVLKIDENGCYELLQKAYGGDLASVDWGESGRDLAKYFEEWPDVDFEEIYRRLEATSKEFAAEFKEVQERIEEGRRLPGCVLGEIVVENMAGFWRSRYSIEGNKSGPFFVYRLPLEPGIVWREERVIHSVADLLYYCEEHGMDPVKVCRKLFECHEPCAEPLMMELRKRYPPNYLDYELRINRPLKGQLELPFVLEDSRAILDSDRFREDDQEAIHLSKTPAQGQLVTETFPTKWVGGLMQRARKAVTLPSKRPQGWTKSTVDLKRFLAVFKSLKIKEGMVLRVYQLCSGGNGYSVVCAMPEDLPFPEALY